MQQNPALLRLLERADGLVPLGVVTGLWDVTYTALLHAMDQDGDRAVGDAFHARAFDRLQALADTLPELLTPEGALAAHQAMLAALDAILKGVVRSPATRRVIWRRTQVTIREHQATHAAPEI